MKKYLLLTTTLIVFSSSVAFAQTIVEDSLTVEDDVLPQSVPTEVYGSAATPQGGQDAALVEQAADAVNPLGNPIPNLPEPSENKNDNQQSSNNSSAATAPTAASVPAGVSEIKPIEQESKQGILQPGELALPQPSTRIENELYQSGNDIIDVQAYPIDDVSTVTEPNIQPTIVSQ